LSRERLSHRIRSARRCPGMSSGRNPIMSCPSGRSPPATPTQYYTQKRFRKRAHLVFRTETARAAAGLDNTTAQLPLTPDFSVTDDVASSQENGMARISSPLRLSLNRIPGVHEIAISRPASDLVWGRACAALAAVRVRMGYHAVGEARNSYRAQTYAVPGRPGYPG